MSRWDERIARARYLAERHPPAADFLTLYEALAQCQRLLAERWALGIDRQLSTGSLLECLDRGLVLDAVPEFLSSLERLGPARMRTSLVAAGAIGRVEWQALLDGYLASHGSDDEPADATQAFVIEALVQPFAEQLSMRRSSLPVDPSQGSSRCPFCDSLPVVGVLREEGHGMKRSLLCARCLGEWSYLRLVCPACGEHRFDALPVYTAEQFLSARVEGCDTCRKYLKTIDASKDNLVVPLVDDFATVALDLWARDHGYVRLRSNLLRTT